MFPSRGQFAKLGKGSLMLDMLDPITGLPTGMQFVGNCSAISITPTETRVELFSNTQHTANLVASDRTSLKYAVAATLYEYTKTNLKLFLLGIEAAANQTLAAAQTKLLTAVKLGQYYELGARDVSNVVVLAGGAADTSAPDPGNVGNGVMGAITRTNPKPGVFHIVMTSAGPTAAFSVTDPDGLSLPAGAVGTLYNQGGLSFTISDGSTDFAIGDGFTITESAAVVVDVDYEVNSKYGVVFIRPQSALISDGIDVHVTFDRPARTMDKIQIGIAGAQLAQLTYLSDDANSSGESSKDRWQFWKVEVAPTGELGLISSDYATFSLAMNVLADDANHPTEPYGIIERQR